MVETQLVFIFSYEAQLTYDYNLARLRMYFTPSSEIVTLQDKVGSLEPQPVVSSSDQIPLGSRAGLNHCRTI